MAKFGIIAALDCEIEHFINDFHAKKTDNPYIFKGEYFGHEIYLTLCGVGKVNAAICTQRLIDITNVEYIINSGVAGGVSENLSVCDLAISETLTYHDFSPIDVLEKYSPYCSVFKADEKLTKLALMAAEKQHSFKYEKGMIVSGDMFVEDKAYNNMLRQKYSAICTEMEGAAVAHTAFANKIPFVVIRAISDNADENADMSFEQMAEIAADHASAVVKTMIENFEV